MIEKLMTFLVFFFSWVALGILPQPFNLLIWFMYFCISLAIDDEDVVGIDGKMIQLG